MVLIFGFLMFLMAKNRTFGIMFSEMSLKNLGLGFVMAAFWIGSFYLYGYSSFKLGNLGSIIGWPLFISISIVVGNMWGIWQGEWKESSRRAKSMLNAGLVVLVVAMIIFGVSNLF
jgi:L-rhamnose-H+ transport protein